MLKKQVDAIEGMPITGFLQGHLAGIASVARKKKILFLEGVDKKDYSGFTNHYSVCCAGPTMAKTLIEDMIGCATQHSVIREFDNHPSVTLRNLVSHHRQFKDSVTNHIMSDFSPSYCYEVAPNNPDLNYFTNFSDEFVAMLLLAEDPKSRHDIRFLLQSREGGKPLEKRDTTTKAKTERFMMTLMYFGQNITLLRFLLLECGDHSVGLLPRFIVLAYQRGPKEWEPDEGVDMTSVYEKVRRPRCRAAACPPPPVRGSRPSPLPPRTDPY